MARQLYQCTKFIRTCSGCETTSLTSSVSRSHTAPGAQQRLLLSIYQPVTRTKRSVLHCPGNLAACWYRHEPHYVLRGICLATVCSQHNSCSTWALFNFEDGSGCWNFGGHQLSGETVSGFCRKMLSVRHASLCLILPDLMAAMAHDTSDG